MNWFFWFLIIIGAIFLWFILSFGYKPIGKFFYKLFKDAKDIITAQDNDKTNDE